MRGSPFTKKKDGKVRDRAGTVIDLFPGVREALLEVHKDDRFRGTKLAIASRTSHERYPTHSAAFYFSLFYIVPVIFMPREIGRTLYHIKP